MRHAGFDHGQRDSARRQEALGGQDAGVIGDGPDTDHDRLTDTGSRNSPMGFEDHPNHEGLMDDLEGLMVGLMDDPEGLMDDPEGLMDDHEGLMDDPDEGLEDHHPYPDHQGLMDDDL